VGSTVAACTVEFVELVKSVFAPDCCKIVPEVFETSAACAFTAMSGVVEEIAGKSGCCDTSMLVGASITAGGREIVGRIVPMVPPTPDGFITETCPAQTALPNSVARPLQKRYLILYFISYITNFLPRL